MEIKQNRREFVKLAGLGAAASLLGGNPKQSASLAAEQRQSQPKNKFNLGLASYTLRKFRLDEVLEMAQQVGLKYIKLKSMHLPLNSKAEVIEKITAKVKDAGLVLYGGGVIYMNETSEVHRAFDYAKAAGMKVIIGVPKHELLGLVEKKVQEYDIKVAIHNHGPGDELYPTPGSAYEKIKDLDSRIGLCHDIGHTKRAGVDPSQATEKYADRLYDVDMKDVDVAAAEGKGIEVGRGVIDIPKFLRTLIKINYTGIVAFEYEKDPNDPLAGLAESVGYVKGVLAVL